MQKRLDKLVSRLIYAHKSNVRLSSESLGFKRGDDQPGGSELEGCYIGGREGARMFFKRLYEWLTMRDYGNAMDMATARNVKRFTRGNVLLKNGHALAGAEYKKLVRAGDKATARLRAAAGR